MQLYSVASLKFSATIVTGHAGPLPQSATVMSLIVLYRSHRTAVKLPCSVLQIIVIVDPLVRLIKPSVLFNVIFGVAEMEIERKKEPASAVEYHGRLCVHT